MHFFTAHYPSTSLPFCDWKSSSSYLGICSRLASQALSLFGDAAVCNFPADEQVEVEGVGADGNTVKVRAASPVAYCMPPSCAILSSVSSHRVIILVTWIVL